MKWQQFMLSTSEFDKRLNHMLRYKIIEDDDVVSIDEHHPDYLSKVDIKGKKDSVMVFNAALYHLIHDRMLCSRFQRFVNSICCFLKVPQIELQNIQNTCHQAEQQYILLLALIYFMS